DLVVGDAPVGQLRLRRVDAFGVTISQDDDSVSGGAQGGGQQGEQLRVFGDGAVNVEGNFHGTVPRVSWSVARSSLAFFLALASPMRRRDVPSAITRSRKNRKSFTSHSRTRTASRRPVRVRRQRQAELRQQPRRSVQILQVNHLDGAVHVAVGDAQY